MRKVPLVMTRILILVAGLTLLVHQTSAFTRDALDSSAPQNAAPGDSLGLTSQWAQAADRSDEYLTTFVGDLSYRWPYRHTALYRPIPAWRYNRVDGLVLGVRKRPLEWDGYERMGIYGQVGYAFELKRVQFEAGAEARLGERYGEEGPDLKFGGAYRRLTTTDDLWKSGWVENTVASFFFSYDFFDYYETEGWTLYTIGKISPYVQLSAGFRSEDHATLARNTGWSLFGGENFRFNPGIEEGRMRSLVFALEGGSVSRFHTRPSGAVYRFEMEIGKGVGGDFAFNRFVADGRAYIRTTRRTTLSLRLRGGTASGESVPLQKMFSLGGIGSVRGYPQNAFRGESMLLGNVEYAISDFEIFGDWLGGLQLSGFFDAAWVSRIDRTSFDADDMFRSAGIGLGFFERRLRLDLAFPLTDQGGTKDPSLWLRLIPAF